jgi:hypothetical protein
VPFADAMSQSMLLPAFVALFGIGAALFLVGATGSTGDDETPASGIRDAPAKRVRVKPSAAEGFASGLDDYQDGFDDDDDYVEYTLAPAPAAPRGPTLAATPPRREERRRPTPAESWRSQLDDMTTTTEIEPIGHGQDGFGIDEDQRLRPMEYPPLDQRRAEPEEPFFDDIDTYGGSSSHDIRRNGYRRPPPDRGPRRRPLPEG